MGVGKEHAPLGEACEVGGGSLRMAPEATDSVIQVVDREQKDVGLALGFSKRAFVARQARTRRAFIYLRVMR
jgi:hypothetical protein